MPLEALPAYPRGWFAVATSADLAVGQVRPLHFFGHELVLFRTGDGSPGLLSAFCPHLGAHLGHGGTVDGAALVCSFHNWRWGSDGGCLGMPYGDEIPASAKARSWTLHEHNGVILTFYDPAGAEPDWKMPVFDDSYWSSPLTIERTIRSHPQEILENVADVAHLGVVHGSRARVRAATDEPGVHGTHFEIKFVSIDDESSSEPLGGSGSCHGPGLGIAMVSARAQGIEMIQRLYVTPIDGTLVKLFGFINFIDDGSSQAPDEIRSQVCQAAIDEWDGDISIWEHKAYQPEPALNEIEAAYITSYRRWFSQFYT